MNDVLSVDFQEDKIDELVNNYFNKDDVTSKLKNMEKNIFNTSRYFKKLL